MGRSVGRGGARGAGRGRAATRAPSPSQKGQSKAGGLAKANGSKDSPFSRANDNPGTDKKRQRELRYWSLASTVHKQAAGAVARMLAGAASRKGGVSLKSLTLAPHILAKKATYAVTHETLRYLPVLKAVEEEVGLLKEHSKLQPEAAYVLIYEVLIGQGCKPHGGAERAVLSRQAALKAALARRMAKARVSEPRQLLSEPEKGKPRPRSARVNTLRMSVEEALEWLRAPPKGHEDRAFTAVTVHSLLPDVLLFPEGTDLHDHPLVENGALILQSVASCMPAHALQPQPDWHCVDCCAAPGNKTTHAAARMNGKGRVMAFDRDKKRLQRLIANAEKAGAANIVAEAKDFMTIDPESERFREVRGVILDPSCSGSGLALTRGDHLLTAHSTSGDGEEDDDEGGSTAETRRVDALAQFQEAALRHALAFPRLERLVYSTCSVNSRENEEVVAAVLPEATARGFFLADPFPSWHRRGLPIVDGAEKLIRTDPYEDGTDGFFVAVFQRGHGGAPTATAAPSGRQPIADGSDGAAMAAAGRPSTKPSEAQRLKKKRKKALYKERQRAKRAAIAIAQPGCDDGSGSEE